jgi:Serine dehydrogenase proteinase
MADGIRSQKTPMFEALNAARYHRQELVRRIQGLTGTSLIAYVSGPDALIGRADTAYFNDLLYPVTTNSSLDLLLHTPGGDIDAAEKLMSILRMRVGVGRLRVIVPDFAKSAGTLMAIGADEVVMSDTSELGPIDPQVTLSDGDGNRTTPVQAYLDAYEQLSKRLQADPEDIAARLLFSKLEPDRIVHFQAVKARARLFAEAQLRRGMCRETGNVTSIAARLLDTKEWPSHGQVINAEEAAGIGITVRRLTAVDPVWDACWRLYCLQRLAVKDDQKIFESEFATLIVDPSTS